MASKEKEKKGREPNDPGGLPVGHPRAGYVGPDLSYHVGTGVIPDEEVEWHEERNDAREEELEEITKAEDEAIEEEQKERDRLAEIAQKRAEHLEKQKYGPTAGQLPGDVSYVEPSAEKAKASSSSGKSS